MPQALMPFLPYLKWKKSTYLCLNYFFNNIHNIRHWLTAIEPRNQQKSSFKSNEKNLHKYFQPGTKGILNNTFSRNHSKYYK